MQWIVLGINACEKLLTIPNAGLHKWCAILVGVNSDFLPVAEKIQNGYRFKELVMKALEICPNDADLHYLLGRFRYEVANLSWVERKVYVYRGLMAPDHKENAHSEVNSVCNIITDSFSRLDCCDIIFGAAKCLVRRCD